ncbi:MAG: hypothetical protein Q4A65_07010 [Bacillota bacterium]|nr:hypothetical protein [Bacillota bacterium]
METILYNIIAVISRIHSYILTLNDQNANSFTDKELHFIIFGIVGICLILALHPLFLWLARKNHTMVISFLYVFTVVLVITFAIEIGQGVTGTGAMEFDDVVYGIGGFLLFFLIFLIIRGIIHLIIRLIRKRERKPRRRRDTEYF